jgi:hypothetical protein
MPVGFGNEPIGRGPRGFRADQPPPSQTDDLHAIRERYCGPGTLNPQVVAFSANQGQRFDLTGTPINGFLLTGMTGQINGYFGDNSNQFGKTATAPHFVVSAGISVQTLFIPLPPGSGYIITLQEGSGSTCTGCITFEYI